MEVLNKKNTATKFKIGDKEPVVSFKINGQVFLSAALIKLMKLKAGNGVVIGIEDDVWIIAPSMDPNAFLLKATADGKIYFYASSLLTRLQSAKRDECKSCYYFVDEKDKRKVDGLMGYALIMAPEVSKYTRNRKKK